MKCLLIVQASTFESIARSSQRRSTLSDNLFLITWMGLIVAFWIGLYYFDKWRKRYIGTGGNARSLFYELCSAHQLTRHERSMLMKAVNAQPETDLPAVFVDPRILENCFTAPAFDTASYRALSKKIFGSVHAK